MRGLVDLGEDAAGQVVAAAAVAVGVHHLVERVAVAGRVEQQQALAPAGGCCTASRSGRTTARSRWLMPTVSISTMCLSRRSSQHQVQVGRVLHRVHRHAEDLAVDAQLLVGADPVAVGGDQRQLVGAEAHHAARRELGGGGGLADAGRPHQRDTRRPAASSASSSSMHRQPARISSPRSEGHALRRSSGRAGSCSSSALRQPRAEAGAEQRAQQAAAHRVAPLLARSRPRLASCSSIMPRMECSSLQHGIAARGRRRGALAVARRRRRATRHAGRPGSDRRTARQRTGFHRPAATASDLHAGGRDAVGQRRWPRRRAPRARGAGPRGWWRRGSRSGGRRRVRDEFKLFLRWWR